MPVVNLPRYLTPAFQPVEKVRRELA